MKLFVAGKTGEEEVARRAMQLLRNSGHTITFDWTSIPHLKPYGSNEDQSRNASILETEAVLKADALILLAHEKGIGMYVELGMALALHKPVFVVGGDENPTMFLFHPLVRRAKTVYDVITQLKSS